VKCAENQVGELAVNLLKTQLNPNMKSHSIQY